MSDVVLRTNAIPIYGFLSYIMGVIPAAERAVTPKILDCGAGGPLPPLALFAQQGFEAIGIDISDEQLERSRQFCSDRKISVEFRKADMRQIPFDANTFDYVYEHYSMCHLDHAGAVQAVSEMLRVLKPGGMAFIGVISTDSWPSTLFGKEHRTGEFVGAEGAHTQVTHSLWKDVESDQLVAAWEVVDKEKRINYLRDMAAEVSIETWMDLLRESPQGSSAEEWRAAYPQRQDYYRYVHTYYYLKKPIVG